MKFKPSSPQKVLTDVERDWPIEESRNARREGGGGTPGLTGGGESWYSGGGGSTTVGSREMR